MKLTCLVVDDSAVQRITLKKLIETNANLELLADCANALEAKKELNKNVIDIIFLDIEMPLINGFDLIDGLKTKPQIVFVSSKIEYAVKAFDYEATDFLHKPITKERFNKSVKKALNLHILQHAIKQEDLGDSILIKSKLKKFKIYLSSIYWVEASGDYLKVITTNNSYVVLSSMKKFEQQLPPSFLRVHKSYIINLEKVEEFNSKEVIIKDKATSIPVSRYKKALLTESMKKL